MRKKINFIVLILFITFVFTGCYSKVSKIHVEPVPGGLDLDAVKTELPKDLVKELEKQSNIKKFKSAEELSLFLEENNTVGFDSGLNRSYQDTNDMAVMTESVKGIGAPMMTTNLGSAGFAFDEGGSDDFSKTNVQVEGVDEADIIKTDGKYIYALVKNELFIIDAYPAEKAEIITKIKFKDRPQDIYINDNKLIIYGRDNSYRQKELYKKFIRRNSFTFFKVFDITDKENPKQVRDLNFEGNYNNSRMIGDYVYFITTNHNYRYYDNEPILPRIVSNEKTVLELEPDIYYFDIPYNSYNITSIHAINIKDENEKINGDVYLMNRNQNMYVSQNNIYVTYTKHISEYQLAMEVMKDIILPIMNEKDQNKINNINEVDNYILSPDEKQRKISNIIERFLSSQDKSEQDRLEEELEKAMKKKYADISKELEKTVIHKIAINKNDIEYKTHGEVTGHVLNQFSMDENKGYFRIATTKNRTWSRFEDGNTKSYNNLYVLDGRLKIVGSLEGLAEDERIKSVRFMQNRAYMVTFKQIDPLFVIDLKNPKKPTVLGELKIPGYSDYLHPYDEDTLIGLGKDAYENRYGGTVTGGVKLSLFDVADVKNPKEIDTFIMGVSGSDSIALHDHKAFLFSHDKNLLSIPVTIRKQSGEKYYNTKLEFSGAAVFTVDKSSFKLKGKIDHSDGGKDSKTDYWRGYNYYDNNVKRALYIEDNLYTFSNKYIMIHAIDDLNKINNVRFVEEEKDFEIENLKESKSKFLNLDNLGIKNSE